MNKKSSGKKKSSKEEAELVINNARQIGSALNIQLVHPAMVWFNYANSDRYDMPKPGSDELNAVINSLAENGWWRSHSIQVTRYQPQHETWERDPAITQRYLQWKEVRNTKNKVLMRAFETLYPRYLRPVFKGDFGYVRNLALLYAVEKVLRSVHPFPDLRIPVYVVSRAESMAQGYSMKEYNKIAKEIIGAPDF